MWEDSRTKYKRLRNKIPAITTGKRREQFALQRDCRSPIEKWGPDFRGSVLGGLMNELDPEFRAGLFLRVPRFARSNARPCAKSRSAASMRR